MSWDRSHIERQAPAPDAPSTGRKAGRKNTKRWCSGKVGREHVLEIVKQNWAVTRACRTTTHEPWWIADGQTKEERMWVCYHQQQCAVCGKITIAFLRTVQCPDWPDPNAIRRQTIHDFADRVSEWHDLPADHPDANLKLHEYLGMTWSEYKDLIEGAQ